MLPIYFLFFFQGSSGPPPSSMGYSIALDTVSGLTSGGVWGISARIVVTKP